VGSHLEHTQEQEQEQENKIDPKIISEALLGCVSNPNWRARTATELSPCSRDILERAEKHKNPV
jgi:hypothetical protein